MLFVLSSHILISILRYFYWVPVYAYINIVLFLLSSCICLYLYCVIPIEFLYMLISILCYSYWVPVYVNINIVLFVLSSYILIVLCCVLFKCPFCLLICLSGCVLIVTVNCDVITQRSLLTLASRLASPLKSTQVFGLLASPLSPADSS